MKKEQWVIAFSNSEDADVYFYCFSGTTEEVKEALYKMATEHCYDCASDIISQPEDSDAIEENEDTGALFCMVTYEDYDYVFTAKRIKTMEKLSK